MEAAHFQQMRAAGLMVPPLMHMSPPPKASAPVPGQPFMPEPGQTDGDADISYHPTMPPAAEVAPLEYVNTELTISCPVGQHILQVHCDRNIVRGQILCIGWGPADQEHVTAFARGSIVTAHPTRLPHAIGSPVTLIMPSRSYTPRL